MNFDEVRDQIYPWIKVIYKPGEEDGNSRYEVSLTGEDAPIYQNWLGNLAIFYVVDTGDKFVLILKSDVPSDLTVDQLHALATANLSRDVDFRFNETVFGGYGILAGGDHEAGSLCLDGVWQWCSDQLQDNLVVGVPTKDIVMMVPASDSEQITSLKKMVLEYFETGDRLLTNQLFLFDKQESKWTVYGQAS